MRHIYFSNNLSKCRPILTTRYSFTSAFPDNDKSYQLTSKVYVFVAELRCQNSECSRQNLQ